MPALSQSWGQVPFSQCFFCVQGWFPEAQHPQGKTPESHPQSAQHTLRLLLHSSQSLRREKESTNHIQLCWMSFYQPLPVAASGNPGQSARSAGGGSASSPSHVAAKTQAAVLGQACGAGLAAPHMLSDPPHTLCPPVSAAVPPHIFLYLVLE